MTRHHQPHRFPASNSGYAACRMTFKACKALLANSSRDSRIQLSTTVLLPDAPQLSQ